MFPQTTLNPEQALQSLRRIVETPANLQEMTLARKIAGVFGLRIGDLEFLHSVIETNDDGSKRPIVIAAPALGISIESTKSNQRITSACSRPSVANTAIAAARLLGPTDAEVFIHNLEPELLRPKFSGKQWDFWGTGSKDQSKTDIIAHRQAETREKTTTLLKALESRQGINSFKNILFLGCGDGCDVNAFLAFTGGQRNDVKITAIDQSQVALQTAKDLNQRLFPASNINFNQLDFNNLFSIASEGPFDLVIAVGVFDRETLNFDEGTRLGSHLRMIMKTEGVLASTAYGYELFEKQNYSDLGYQVFQSCIPSRLFTNQYPTIYLMRNTTSAIKSSEDFALARSNRLWRE